jgi:hypothetical protein
MVVIPLPKMQLPPSVGQGEEDFHVQTLVTPLAVEAFTPDRRPGKAFSRPR